MASTGTNMAQSNPDLQKAVKYCPACSIIVFPAKRRGDSVAVTVADNGPGRTIARVHGAEIFATDSVWGGAAFTLVLPHVPMAELDDEDAIDDAGDVSATEAGGGRGSALPAGGGK